MTPCRGNTIHFRSSQQHSRLRLGPLKGFLAFSTLCVASKTTENRGHCLVCRARLGGLRKASRTIDANLDSALVENALVFYRSKNWVGSSPPWSPLFAPTPPPLTTIFFQLL